MLESLRQSHSELETKATEYLSRLKDDREEQATIEEQLKKELSQQVKPLCTSIFVIATVNLLY